jgi:2-(1,2-epoxy-1,2-dihydrophenyl)acetyl-CoA isomerase
MSELLTTLEGGVLTLTLNRPDAMNAFTVELLHGLVTALDTAADPAVRVIVLTGAGTAFSAGQDLKELVERNVTSYREQFARYIPLLRRLREVDQPVVAAIDGVAAGGGLGLALACDFRVASNRAVLTPAFSKIGLIPDSGLTYTLPRIVGPAVAFELLTLSPKLSADEALRLGLVHRVWEAERFSEELARFAEALAVGPTRAYGLTKRLLERTWDRSFEEALGAEGEAQDVAGRTEDHRGALAAFLARRPIEFRGQ